MFSKFLTLLFAILSISGCLGSASEETTQSLASIHWLRLGDACDSAPKNCLLGKCVQASSDSSDLQCLILAGNWGCNKVGIPQNSRCAWPSTCSSVTDDVCSVQGVTNSCLKDTDCKEGLACYDGTCLFGYGDQGCGTSNANCQDPSVCSNNTCLLPASNRCYDNSECLTGHCNAQSLFHMDTKYCVLNKGDPCDHTLKNQCKIGNECKDLSGEGYTCTCSFCSD